MLCPVVFRGVKWLTFLIMNRVRIPVVSPTQCIKTGLTKACWCVSFETSNGSVLTLNGFYMIFYINHLVSQGNSRPR